jgi:hypothetical protein
MTEGKWFGITITEFAYLLGFDEEDLGRMKIHRDHDMDVKTPPEIIPYYRLNHSIWSLSDNKEASC